MSTSIGNLHGTLSLKSAEFERGMQRARGATTVFRGELVSLAAKVLTVQAAWQALSRSIRFASGISDMADQTRTSIEGFQVLNSVSRDAGVKQEQLRQALVKLNATTEDARAGAENFREAFRKLNIDVDQFARLGTERRLEELGRAFVASGESSRALREISKILGEESGPRMIEVLRRMGTEGLEPLSAKAKQAGEVLSELNTMELDKLSDSIVRFSVQADVALGAVLVELKNLWQWGTMYMRGPFQKLPRKPGAALGITEDFPWDTFKGAPKPEDTASEAEAIAQRAAKELEIRNELVARAKTQVQDIWEGMLSERDKMQMEILELESIRNTLTRYGELTPFADSTITDKIREIEDQMNRLGRTGEDVGRAIGLTFTSAFEDAIVEGRNLSEVIRGIGQDIVRLLIRKFVTEALFKTITNLFTGGGGVSGMANGGDVSAGKAILVGERGPEFFVAPDDGKIVPNHMIGKVGGGGPSMVNYIDARGADAAAVARLEATIVALNGSIEKRSVAAVFDAQRRRRI